MQNTSMELAITQLVDEQKNIKNLRLNASRELIRESGGVMRVDSTPGKGTKVTIRFPFG